MIVRLIILSLVYILVGGCSQEFTPKPRGYFRIDFPEKAYQKFDTTFPYQFEYPVYGKVVKDMDANTEPYWINVEFQAYKAKIYLSYKRVNKDLNGFIEDSHTLAYKHAIKADGIDEQIVSKPEKKVYGLIYEIEGNAASSFQFYLTDSNAHFLRGSLYFEAQTNKDSLAPAINFFRADVLHLIETFNWKKLN
jgi:gliding motility-associated lipoprotein GldD